MSTTIVFDGAHVPVRELAVVASVGHFAKPRLGWTVSAGGLVGGSIEGRDLGSGATISGGLSWLPLYEGEHRPFVGLSATVGTSLAWATADDGARHVWSPWDLRGGAMVGKTIHHVVAYAAARGFGGPVFWHRGGDGVVGGDRWHVTLGAGVIARLPHHFDLSIEAMPLGEQSATGGVTLHL